MDLNATLKAPYLVGGEYVRFRLEDAEKKKTGTRFSV